MFDRKYRIRTDGFGISVQRSWLGIFWETNCDYRWSMDPDDHGGPQYFSLDRDAEDFIDAQIAKQKRDKARAEEHKRKAKVKPTYRRYP